MEFGSPSLEVFDNLFHSFTQPKGTLHPGWKGILGQVTCFLLEIGLGWIKNILEIGEAQEVTIE